MSVWAWLLVAAGIGLALCLAAALALLAAGRRAEARALAGFIPDCAVLFGRLLRDPRVPRRLKLVVALLVVYLMTPVDLVPDFVPGAGQLDDAVLVALVLRRVVRSSGAELVGELWPGPPRSLAAVLRLAGLEAVSELPASVPRPKREP